MNVKVAEINLEQGSPTVSDAILRMKNSLATYKARGFKATILIHGYGSSGVGGSIKTAVLKNLGDGSMRGLVRSFVCGEQWYCSKREFLSICPSLKDFERRIDNNSGVTVVILR